MEKVNNSQVSTASFITIVEEQYWELESEQKLESVFYLSDKGIYLILENDFFDSSDLAELNIEISKGNVFELEEVKFPEGCKCYFNVKTNEYVGVIQN